MSFTLLAQNGTFQDIWEFLQVRGINFVFDLAIAVAIFYIGRWIARMLRRFVHRFCLRSSNDEMLARFVENVVYALLMVLVIVAALSQLGIPTTSMAAAIAAGGLAVGLALQGSLSNFAAGVMVILFKPFRTGDYVEAGSVAGTVVEITIFSTILHTPDNSRLVVPNSEFINNAVKNYSANEQRRIDLVIGCGYNDDLKAVKEFLVGVLESDERVLKDPAPTVAVHELGDNSVNFVVRPWVNSTDYWSTRWDLIEAIKVGFDERGYSIPFPQRDVHLHNVSA